MQVQIIDTRPPLSAVIALAKAEQDSHLPKWREDMTAMSAEVARKYFGALTEEVVRDGVDASVNLLSIGLLRSTSGAVEPSAWLQTMRAAGVRGVSRLAVEMIKSCDSLPEDTMVFASPDYLRRSLLLTVLSFASRTGASRAYGYLVRETDSRMETKRLIDLAEWLLANTPSGRVARRAMDEFFGFDTPEAEIVIHHLLSLSCGVAKAKPYSESSFLDQAPETQVTKLGPRLLTAARRRYDDLTAKIPTAIRPALVLKGETWFDRYILPTTKAAKPAEDLPPAPASARQSARSLSLKKAPRKRASSKS